MSRIRTHHPTLALVLLGFLAAWLAPVTASAQDDEQEILPEWEDAGVIEAGEYESPTFGYTLEWDDTWLINPDLEEEAVISSGGNDPFDIISLHLQSSEVIVGVSGYSFAGFGYEAPETAGAEYVEYWESGDVLDVFEDLDSAEVIHSDSDDDHGVLVAIAEYDDGAKTVWYRDLRVLDAGETLVLTTLNAPLDDFERAYETANDSLEFNGDVPFTYIGNTDLENVFESVSDSTTGPDEPPDDDDEDTESGEYLDAIAIRYIELDTSYDRFFEILGQDEISDADFTEVTEILDLWVNAEDEAEQLDPVDGYEDIHDAYLAYAGLMTDAGTAFEEFLQSEQDSAEYDAASDAFFEATTDAEKAGTDLADLLEEENIDLGTSGTDDDEPEDDEDDDIDSSFI